METFLFLFLGMVAMHFLADYPLQGDAVAIHKSRHVKDALSQAVPWYWWMTGHAAMHAVGVYIITRSMVWSIVEFGIHFITDMAKCDKVITLNQDQFVHISAKLFYATWLGILVPWLF